MWAHRIWLGCLLLVGCVYHEGAHADRTEPSAQEAGAAGHSAGAATGRAISQAEFCEQWARAACSDEVISVCQASDAEECRQTQAEFCRGLAPDEIASPGRDACISAVAAAYRDADLRDDELLVVLRFGGPCARSVSGTRKQGDGCTQSSECDVAHGYACVKKADTGEGSCQEPQSVEPGRDCRAPDEQCTEGFFCDGRHCIETLAEGEPCLLHEQCGAAGYCDGGGSCAARRAVNDRCESDEECARGICSELDGKSVCTDRVVLSRADPLCANLR